MRRPAVAAAVCVAAAWPAAHAELLSIQSQWQWRAEADDNAALLASGAGTTNRVSLRAGAVAARESERGSTKLDAGLQLRQGDMGEGRAADGRIALQQRWQFARDGIDGSVGYARDQTLDNRRDAADIALGNQRRDSRTAGASWSHGFDERWSGQAGVSTIRTDYTDDDSSDFRNRTWSVGVNRRVTERLRVGIGMIRSDYEQPHADMRTTSDSWRLNGSYAVDERGSLSFGFGGYRSTTRYLGFFLACPLQQLYCDTGIVAPVLVKTELDRRARGTQYDLSWDGSLDERTQSRVSASRDLSPSGLGVQRSDRLGLALSRQLAPQWRANLAWSLSRERGLAGIGGPQPALRTLEIGAGWQLAERWTLNVGASQRRYTESRDALHARSNAISIALQYQPPTLMASR